jgi:LysR family transcriptional regulator, nod-box dependent transcriptional activator
MLLRRHNLNLLPILRELLRTQSVTRTADAVGLGQSAVSSALARLREEFDDDLLIMVGRKLELTEKALTLVAAVERTCAEAEALLRPTRFCPAEESRRFVIATADYVSYLLAPALVQLLAQEAPSASVHFIDLGSDLEPGLMRGEIDFIVIPEETADDLVASYSRLMLFRDQTVVISAANNRRISEGLTREVYETSPHAMFSLPPRKEVSFEAKNLEISGIRQKNRVLVEQFLTLPAIVEATDCLSLIQRKLALRFQRSHDIRIHDAPFLIGDLKITAYWPRGFDRDPAHAWFRRKLKDVSDQIDVPSE